MARRSRKKGRHRFDQPEPPQALNRPPRTDLSIRMDDLDARIEPALEQTMQHIHSALEKATGLPGIRLKMTHISLLRAMEATHRSLRYLIDMNQRDPAVSVDALPLARIQLERCLLATLLVDNPKRWHSRYRKNAFKAVAAKYFRDQRIIGHFEPWSDYFGPNGDGITCLRNFAREMDVSEGELQTLRSQILDEPQDPRFKPWYIANMPTPAKTVELLKSKQLTALARAIYPYYDNLSHFSHGGLAGVMTAALLDPRTAMREGEEFDHQDFHNSNIIESTLPLSYVALATTALLFCHKDMTETLSGSFVEAWDPYLSDGSALGIAVWDTWAQEIVKPQGDKKSDQDPVPLRQAG